MQDIAKHRRLRDSGLTIGIKLGDGAQHSNIDKSTREHVTGRGIFDREEAVQDSNVTNQLRTQIRGNWLNLQLMNQTMGGDPAVGHNKALTVWCTLNGHAVQIVVNENGYLNLQGDNGSAGDGEDDQRNGNDRVY